MSTILTQSDSALPDDTPAEGGVAAAGAAVVPLGTLLALLAPAPPLDPGGLAEASVPVSPEAGTAATPLGTTPGPLAEAGPNVQALLQSVSKLPAQVDAPAPPQIPSAVDIAVPQTAVAPPAASVAPASAVGSPAGAVAIAPARPGAQSGTLIPAIAVLPSGDTPLPAATVIESLIPSSSDSTNAPAQSAPGSLSGADYPKSTQPEPDYPKSTQPEPEPVKALPLTRAEALGLKIPTTPVSQVKPVTSGRPVGSLAAAPSTPAGGVVVSEVTGVPLAPPTPPGSIAVLSAPVAFAAEPVVQELPAVSSAVQTGTPLVSTVPITLVVEAAVPASPVAAPALSEAIAPSVPVVAPNTGAEAGFAFDAPSDDGATEGHSAGQGLSKPSTGPAVTVPVSGTLADAAPTLAPVAPTVAEILPPLTGELPAPVLDTPGATHATLSGRPVPQYTSLPHMGDHVVRAAQFLAREHGGIIQLRLEPEALGRLTVQVLQDHEMIRVELTVQSHQVREVLQGQLSYLKQQLADQGLVLNQLTVSVGTESGQQPADHDHGLPQPSGQGDQSVASAEPAAEPVASLAPGPVTAGLLDLIA